MSDEKPDKELKKENEIVRQLTERFSSVCVTVQRERRIWAQVKREEFIPFLTYLHDELKFTSLCTVTGLDLGEEYQLIYHLANEGGVVISARENAPKTDPVFDTATNLFKGGMLYELEAQNLLGLKIRDIPNDIRYPLPDNWPKEEYPLRKEWKELKTSLDKESKANFVQPAIKKEAN